MQAPSASFGHNAPCLAAFYPPHPSCSVNSGPVIPRRPPVPRRRTRLLRRQKRTDSPELQRGGRRGWGRSPPSPRTMRRPWNTGGRESHRPVWVHSFPSRLLSRRKKKAAECRFWQKYPRPQMHLPARPRCSLCLCPSGRLRPALAFILPADFRQRGDRRLGEGRHQGKEPGDNWKRRPLKSSAPRTNG